MGGVHICVQVHERVNTFRPTPVASVLFSVNHMAAGDVLRHALASQPKGLFYVFNSSYSIE